MEGEDGVESPRTGSRAVMNPRSGQRAVRRTRRENDLEEKACGYPSDGGTPANSRRGHPGLIRRTVTPGCRALPAVTGFQTSRRVRPRIHCSGNPDPIDVLTRYTFRHQGNHTE